MRPLRLTPSLLLLGALLLTPPPLLAENPNATFQLIQANSSWHYWNNPTPPDSDWTQPTFNDQTWPQGNASLGFGHPDGHHPLTITPNLHPWTTYFRQSFDLENPQTLTNLHLSLLCDDGAVLYLNGQEILRHNMPAENPTLPNTPSTATRLRFYQLQFTNIPLPNLTQLLTTSNVLSAEVHHAPLWQSDLAFSLELTADAISQPAVSTTPNYQLPASSSSLLQLPATFHDDGFPLPENPDNPNPTDPHKLRWQWSTVSTPPNSQGIAWSGDPTSDEAFTYTGSPNAPYTPFSSTPTAHLDVPGLYSFKLEVSDGQQTTSRTVTAYLPHPLSPPQLGYAYLSPKPNAEFTSRKTQQIIVRFNSAPPQDLLNLSSFISVYGSTSGYHSGHTRIASDQRTISHSLVHGFHDNELVTVTLTPTLPPSTPNPPQPFQFQFMVNQPTPNSSPNPWSPVTWTLPDPNNSIPNPPPPPTLPHTPAPRITANGVSIPSDFPQAVVTTSLNPSPDYLFLSNPGLSSTPYSMILDNQGNPVWYDRQAGWGLKIQPDQSITRNGFTATDQNFTPTRTYKTQNGFETDNHALKVLPNGHYLILGARTQPGVDMTRYLTNGNPNTGVLCTTLQEFTPENELILQLRPWDLFDIRDVDPAIQSPTNATIGFPHMNAIDVDADNHLILSSRNLSEITKINRDTGEIIWRLGGARSTFTFVNDPLNGFRSQHAVSALGNNHYLLFDNGNGHIPPVSRAVEYFLDTNNLTATLVWQYRNTPDYHTPYMGNAQRLPNGNTLVNFVSADHPKVIEVNPAGQKTFEMFLLPGSELYQAHRFPWTGTTTTPYLITESSPENVTLIFNQFGDPSIHHYRVYGDITPNPTTLLATTTNTLLQLNQLPNNSHYYFQVTAVSTNGTESPPSNQESLTVNLIQPGTTLTSNSDFSQGTNHWTFTSPNPNTATWSTANNNASIQIETPFTQLADIQLTQSPIPLAQNRTYVLQLDASATQPRTIQIQLTPTSNPSTTYQSFFPFLTPIPQHLTLQFTMNHVSDPAAQLAFLLGGSDRDVTLDNVELWMIAPGDLNLDRKVDLLDLSILTSQWLQQGPNLSADLNHDGKVNFLDHAILMENWSPSSPTNP